VGEKGIGLRGELAGRLLIGADGDALGATAGAKAAVEVVLTELTFDEPDELLEVDEADDCDLSDEILSFPDLLDFFLAAFVALTVLCRPETEG